MKCECVTKHSGSFSFIKHVQHSHINSTMSTKLMKVLWVFLHGFIHMNKGGDGIWKAFATFFWFQLPYYCLVIIVLMEENFFSKISNRYSLKFKLTRYYENDSYPQMREIYCTVIQLWSEHFLSIPQNKYWTVVIADKLYTNWIHMCLVHPISHLQLLMS